MTSSRKRKRVRASGRVPFVDWDKWYAEQCELIRRSERITAADLAVTVNRVPFPLPSARVERAPKRKARR